MSQSLLNALTLQTTTIAMMTIIVMIIMMTMTLITIHQHRPIIMCRLRITLARLVLHHLLHTRLHIIFHMVFHMLSHKCLILNMFRVTIITPQTHHIQSSLMTKLVDSSWTSLVVLILMIMTMIITITQNHFMIAMQAVTRPLQTVYRPSL